MSHPQCHTQEQCIVWNSAHTECRAKCQMYLTLDDHWLPKFLNVCPKLKSLCCFHQSPYCPYGVSIKRSSTTTLFSVTFVKYSVSSFFFLKQWNKRWLQNRMFNFFCPLTSTSQNSSKFIKIYVILRFQCVHLHTIKLQRGSAVGYSLQRISFFRLWMIKCCFIQVFTSLVVYKIYNSTKNRDFCGHMISNCHHFVKEYIR